MNSLPGGRLAPPPPVSRVAVGGLAFLLTSVFCFAWAGVEVLKQVTTKENSITLVGSSLTSATNDALVEVIRANDKAPEFEVVHDLVKFKVTRDDVADIHISEVLARQRASELWVNGYPRDPGPNRTFTNGTPRAFISLFTSYRHKQMGPAGLAALFGIGAGMLVCAFMATGAARFALPGAAALLGYGILRYHIRLLDFWFEKNGADGLKYQVNFKLAANASSQRLLFVGLALLVAGLIYSTLLGGTRNVLDSRGSAKKKAVAKAKKKKAKAAAAAAAAAAYAAAAAEAEEPEAEEVQA